MEKVFEINLEYNSIALYSPRIFNIKEGSNFLKEKLAYMDEVAKLINDSKIIVLKFDDVSNYTLHFSTDPVTENVLNNYNAYLRRGIKIKNKQLLIKDIKELEKYSHKDNKYSINLKNGYYIVHIFTVKDKDIYFFFERINKKPTINAIFNNNFEIMTKKETKRLMTSSDYNTFTLNNYSTLTKEEIDEKFINNKNNFIYNLGKINITSGKLAIFDATNKNNISAIINYNEYLDKPIKNGKYKVQLSMRKSHYFGTYITGVKIIFTKDKVDKYILAETQSNKTIFPSHNGFGGICDFEALEKYNNVLQSMDYLPKNQHILINAFDKNSEENKEIIDKNNSFLLWDIPTTKNNIVIYNTSLYINSYKAYYGIDKDENIVELVIPLINNEIFKYQELEITKDKEKEVNKHIRIIKNAIYKHINSLLEEDNSYIPSNINLPENIKRLIENVAFNIMDLNLEKEFIQPLMDLFEEFPNVSFYTKSNILYGLFEKRYEFKNLIYESTKNNPTMHKVFILAKYLYETGYKAKENKKLLKLLKTLRKHKNRIIKHDATMYYNQLVGETKRKIKLCILISFLINFVLLLTEVIFSPFQYDTIINDQHYTTFYPHIESIDEKYRVYYNIPSRNFDSTKMNKDEVWFSEPTNDTITSSRMIKLKIFDEDYDIFLKNLTLQKEKTCSSNTIYSKIECYNEINENNYTLNNITYHSFGYSFVENETYYAIKSYLIYKLDENTFVCVYNDVYDFSQKEFEQFASNIIESIKVKK